MRVHLLANQRDLDSYEREVGTDWNVQDPTLFFEIN